MRKSLASVLVAALLAGCAVGPDYHAASPHVAANFAAADTAPPVATFWTSFRDPVLSTFVEQALRDNTDLRQALARLDRARAISRQSVFDLLPTVTAGGGYTAARTAVSQTLPGAGRDVESIDAGINATWELDLFGRLRRGLEADRAEAEAAAADLRAVQVSIAADVARAYFELRGHQEQLRVAQRNADNQRDTLRLTETLRDAGRGTDFDTARATAQLESTLARIPALEALIVADKNRLAVLMGREPGTLTADLDAAAPAVALPENVAVGSPAELLRRRPDVQAAERRLAAATARVGVATADLFPRLTLGGSAGTVAPTLGGLFTGASEALAASALVDWAFLDVGRVKARIEAANADARGNLAAYEGTVLRAVEESENALIAYDRTRRETSHLQEAAAAGREGARLARVRFENGAADFLPVLDAERSLLQIEDQLADTETRTATSLVAVYKVVAGGWPDQMPGSEPLPILTSATGN